MAWVNRDKIYFWVESWSPIGLAVATMVTCIYNKDLIIKIFVDEKLSLSQLYTAIFGWASITTGFIFGVYGLILSKTDGFINEVKHTRAMRIFLRYTWRSVKLGFLLTLFGIPFLVSNSDIKDLGYWMFIAGAAYTSLFVYSFASTIRIAYIFSIMINVQAVSRLPA